MRNDQVNTVLAALGAPTEVSGPANGLQEEIYSQYPMYLSILAHLPCELLERVSNLITNEIFGVSRVKCDVSSSPLHDYRVGVALSGGQHSGGCCAAWLYQDSL